MTEFALATSARRRNIRCMQKFSREALLLYAVISAAIAAFLIGHIAFIDLGFSGGEIRTGALGGAGVIAALLFAGSTSGRRRGK
jgi:hypothetical protein